MKLGIDLGTTNSVVSVYKEDGTVEVLKNLDGDFLTPSVVMVGNQSIVVGKRAKAKLKEGAENVVGSFKVNMGSIMQYNLGNKTLTPVELSACVLKYLKESAEKATGEKVTGAVITVPAYFTELQRKATREAGEKAGLIVDRIINEPTAAALSYGINLDEEQTLLVYDLGGGTFDVSILHAGDGVVDVIAIKGDNKLGGDNFDRELASMILKALKKLQRGFNPNETAITVLIELAREAKEALSYSDSVDLDLTKLKAADPNYKGPDTFTVPRKNFETGTKKFVDRTVKLMFEAMAAAKEKGTDKIDKILFVGGSTRIPIVKTVVEEATGMQVIQKDIDPDLSVSIGAAIQSSILTGQNKDMVLLDVTPLDLSIEIAGGFLSTLVKANSSIPVKKDRIFTTTFDNQESVTFKVWQGNNPIAQENEYLGEFTLDGIRKAPAGVPQFEVSFSLNINGELSVTAMDISTLKSASIKRKIR